MPAQSYILATAGHVDHGKSSLVKALTGTDPDRLPEEKARGITIDLGFAHLELPAPAGHPAGIDRFSCGIVDVPGHEDFVKNMVAGVGSIDLALLVVAADDGWMPQTEEHLQILLYLGVTRAVIALAKIDLAPDEAAAIEGVRRRLAGSPLAQAPIVPTAAPTGRGLDELRAALAAVLAETPAPPDLGKPRLGIDRVFVLPGAGTIVTGTLSGGTLTRGDAVVVQPGKRPARIRTCHSHGRDVERVAPGTRTALNLPDVPATEIHRGQVITREKLGDAARTFDVLLEKSGRLAGTGLPAARPLTDGTLVRVHLGSASAPARVRLLRGDALSPGDRQPAQLRLAEPLFALAGDRFVLRDASEQATLAGGLVLDPEAPRAHARAPERVALLAACGPAPDTVEPFLRSRLRQGGVQRSDTLLLRSRFSARVIATGLGRLIAAGEVVLAGSLVAPADTWKAALETATRLIDLRHSEHPEHPGLPLTELRAALESGLGLRTGFDEFLSALARTGFATHGAFVRRAGHRPALPPGLEAAGQRLRDTLARHLLDPPNRRELAPDLASQQALRFLVQNAEIVELDADTVVSSTAFQAARDRIRVLLRQRGRATASELRQLLGTHRRILIPLLEKLDRDGVTRRDGDHRTLA